MPVGSDSGRKLGNVHWAQSSLGFWTRRKTARKFLPPFLCTFLPSSVQVPRRPMMTSPTWREADQTHVQHTLRKPLTQFPPSHSRLASARHSGLFADQQRTAEREERLSNAARWPPEVKLIEPKIAQDSILQRSYDTVITLHSAEMCQLPSARTNESYSSYYTVIRWLLLLPGK